MTVFIELLTSSRAHFRQQLSTLVLLSANLCPAYGYGQAELTLLFEERPPYTYSTPEGPRGQVVERTESAVKLAGIPFQWLKTPPMHQLALIQANSGFYCATDWYDTPERRAYAQISVKVLQDGPFMLISRHGDTRFATPTSLKRLLGSEMVLAKSIGYSMGNELDQLVTQKKLKTMEIRGNDVELLGSIVKRRADYALIYREELDDVLTQFASHRTELDIHTVKDFPEPEWTHLLCTKQVDYATMSKLNNALREVVSGATH